MQEFKSFDRKMFAEVKILQLKTYQQETLSTLEKFLSTARLIGSAAAFAENRNAPSYPPEYFPLPKLEDAPYICLRLPTGGGKTLLGAYAIPLAAENFLARENPLVLWLVPTDTIRQQTLKLLREPRNFYRQVLDAAFKSVKIFDVTEFRELRPQDLTQSLNIFVATFQSFRVEKSEGRKVYQANEFLEPCFRNISQQEYFEVGERGGYKSFGNLIAYLRPLMIIDEAHNYSSPLSLEIMQKLRPSAVIELTATPAQNSNVLYQVSASELKAEEMIKLPIELTENQSWEMTIDSAVQKRTALEKLAAREAEYVRPIALFQAENKDKEVTVAVVKKYLIDGAKVPESQIAVQTGERHELDGVNLSARDCPIRYVITVQALKEGWDCPFAYVFCSLAKIHSPKDAEQLLGRVLRMPYAARRESPELNRAYAFVAVESWMSAVEKIRDNLLSMGFEDAEANVALKIQPKLFDEPRTIKISTTEKPQLGTLNLFLQGAAVVEKTSDGYELTLENLSAADVKEVETNANKIFRGKAAREELLKVIRREEFIPRKETSPAERGVKFEIPMLCLDFGDGAEIAERENFLPTTWRLTGNYDTDLPNFSRNVEAQTYEFDVAGHKLTEKYLGDGMGDLFFGETNWTLAELIRWFAEKILSPDLIFEDVLEFIRRILNRLSAEQNIPLEEFVRLRFSLLKVLEEKIKSCRVEAYKAGWEEKLFGDGKSVRVRSDIKKIFEPENYPAKSFYNGRVQFQKHFYSTVGDMNNEEIFCAQLIDANKNVETWIRNVEHEPLYSFWLPTHADKFYPDFVVKLMDGTYAAVEYKGEHLATSSDSEEKNLIGELWAQESGGLCKFLMATKNSDGRSLQTQLKEILQ
ncbi:MAG: DEAD/DEAH box helicase family protein [Selenomonadaceae bacterium]|nr:DEAD/DEAH box helicase family protein [Selenomonadaceae bacterium]